MHAPPFEFLEKTFLPLMNRMGAHVTIGLERYGFYPPGGGRLNVSIEPTKTLKRLDINERGEIRGQRARALVVKLPPAIAERELAVVGEKMGWNDDQLRVETSNNALSPGNVLTIEIESQHLTEVITGMGERGVRAERVAERAVVEAQQYLMSGAPVGEHLADQLLVPMALAPGGGSYVTGPPSLHTTTNIQVIQKFLNVEISTSQVAERMWKVEVRS